MVWWCKTTEKICEICSRKISLSENLSGLVFNDKIFLCEECCNEKSEEDLIDFTKTIMQDSTKGMPIVLWLLHEQNKNKTMMSGSK